MSTHGFSARVTFEGMKRTLLVGLSVWIFAVTHSAQAQDRIYSCKLETMSHLSHRMGAATELKTGRMEGEVRTPKDAEVVSIAVTKDHALFKKSGLQSKLTKVGDRSFYEKLDSGDVFFWTLIPGSKFFPTYFIHQQPAPQGSPQFFTSAYRCD